MRLTVGDVFGRLIAEGLAPAESATRARHALDGLVDSTPWFARVIAGVGAWVATGFLIGFLFITKIVNDGTSSVIVGAILVAGAVLVRRIAGADEDFKRQLTLAASLAGQVLVIVGILDETKSATAAGLVALAISVSLIPLVVDQVHRFMSALIGSVATIAAVADLRLAWSLGTLPPFGDVVVRGGDLAVLVLLAVSAYVWRAGVRERSRELTEMLEPVGYGTIAALFAVILFSTFFAVADDLLRGTRSARGNVWHLGPLTTAGITVALVALVRVIFGEQRARPSTRSLAAAVAAVVLLGALTLSTPGVSAAVTVLVLGFDRRDRALVGLAVVFLVMFSSAYYYGLRMTLLEKSIVLAASGLLVLAAGAYLELRLAPSEADA